MTNGLRPFVEVERAVPRPSCPLTIAEGQGAEPSAAEAQPDPVEAVECEIAFGCAKLRFRQPLDATLLQMIVDTFAPRC